MIYLIVILLLIAIVMVGFGISKLNKNLKETKASRIDNTNIGVDVAKLHSDVLAVSVALGKARIRNNTFQDSITKFCEHIDKEVEFIRCNMNRRKYYIHNEHEVEQFVKQLRADLKKAKEEANESEVEKKVEKKEPNN